MPAKGGLCKPWCWASSSSTLVDRLIKVEMDRNTVGHIPPSCTLLMLEVLRVPCQDFQTLSWIFNGYWQLTKVFLIGYLNLEMYTTLTLFLVSKEV